VKNDNKIVVNSVAVYFSKNVQQLGFSTPQKAFLTGIKELVDNSLDACNSIRVLPKIDLTVEKLGPGHTKNSDRIRILLTDNGPGLEKDEVVKAFGTMLASAKFSRARVSRGIAGIGASALLMWAQLTNASGMRIISKTKKMKKAYSCTVEIDIKNNVGIVKNESNLDWDQEQGLSVDVIIDGKIQLNGESGILNFLNGTCLTNPDLTLSYQFPDMEKVTIERVSTEPKFIPEAVPPHPHTLKFGEFISHSHQFDQKVSDWLKEGFSRVNDGVIKALHKAGIPKGVLNKKTSALSDIEFKDLYKAVQETPLQPPATSSLTSIGEEALSASIKRLGNVDFSVVVSRKPTVCDFKPVQIEIALARLNDTKGLDEEAVQVLRFANFVPLLFEKSSDVSIEAIQSINWKAYGINQSKGNLPTGPFIFAVSIISPFIKFKNASKEAIDSSDELLEEIRLALMQAGQRLSKHIRAEAKKHELEEKRRYIEQFGPILIQSLIDISGERQSRFKKLENGLNKILGRETTRIKEELQTAEEKVQKMVKEENKNE